MFICIIICLGGLQISIPLPTEEQTSSGTVMH